MPACYVYQSTWDDEDALAHGYIPQWASEKANRVKGTDGSMFKHPMEEDSIFTFQVRRDKTRHGPSRPLPLLLLCDPSSHTPPHQSSSFISRQQEDYRRYVELVYAGDVTDFHGLTLRRYVFKEEDFRNDSAMSQDWYQDNLPT